MHRTGGRARNDGRHDLAFLLPVIVISELLGLPVEDHQPCRVWAEAVGRGLDPLQTPETLAAAHAGVVELSEYMRDHVRKRRRSPGKDLLSALIAAEEAGSRLNDHEVISTANLLFFSGHQTTRDLIGNGALALLRHPGELARLRREPWLIRNAIEELLCYDTPVQMTPRWARTWRSENCGSQPVSRACAVAGGGKSRPGPLPQPRPTRSRPAGCELASRLRRRHPFLPGRPPCQN